MLKKSICIISLGFCVLLGGIILSGCDEVLPTPIHDLEENDVSLPPEVDLDVVNISTPRGGWVTETQGDIDKELVQDIVDRVEWIIEHTERQIYEEHKYNNVVIFRHLQREIYGEFPWHAGYNLCYDESGNLIFAGVGHFRGLHYSIHFQDEQALYIEIGGVLYNIQQVDIREILTMQYALVMDDIDFVLSNAY